MNNKKYVQFVLLPSKNQNGKARFLTSYGIGTYTHPITGEIVGIFDKKHPKTQEPIHTYYRFSDGNMSIKVLEGKKCWNYDFTEKVSVVDIIKNHPDCEGSPSAGEYAKPRFRLVDAEKDAEILLEAKELKVAAITAIQELDTEETHMLASMFGETRKGSKFQMLNLWDKAEHQPQELLDALESNDFRVRGFIRLAVEKGVIRRVGSIHKYKDQTIGTDENSTIAGLLSNNDLKLAIEVELDQKIPSEVAETKELPKPIIGEKPKRGRPAKK